MGLKMSTPWKHPKTGMYWLRRRVPQHLVALIGRKEEKLSLRTKDPAEAKRLFVTAMAALEDRWANLGKGMAVLSDEEAVSLAQFYYDQLLQDFRAEPWTQVGWNVEIGKWCFHPPGAGGPRRNRDGLDFKVDEDEMQLDRQEDLCRSFARARLEGVGRAASDENVKRLARFIAQALQAAAVELRRLASTSAFGPLVAGQNSALGKPAPVVPAVSAVLKASTVIDGWTKERRPTAKTLYTYRRVLDAFMDHVGSEDLGSVTQKHVAGWKAKMLDEGLSAKTIAASKLGAVRAMFQWAVDNGHLAENPFTKVSISVKRKPGENRRGYTDEEAALVLRAAEKEASAYRRWTPLLCAYTGARVAEIAQLRKQDVIERQGKWCLQLTPEAGSLKNANSERVVPLHPKVVEAGFLAFVEKLKAGPIFAEVPPDRFGSRGGNMTKLISRWVRDEVKITDTRVAPSHAWRHRFKTLCRRYGVAADVGDALTGHSARTVGDAYGAFEVAALYRELCKIP